MWCDAQKLCSALPSLKLHPVLHREKYISNCKLLRLPRISASERKSGSDPAAKINLKCLGERDEILVVNPSPLDVCCVSALSVFDFSCLRLMASVF